MGNVKNRPNKRLQSDFFSSNFKIIFLAVVALTLISLACCIYLSSKADLSSVEQDLFKTLMTTWKIGFVAIVYLICKKIPKEFL